MPTICVDVMGSDQGPSVVLEGVEQALAKDAELVILLAGTRRTCARGLLRSFFSRFCLGLGLSLDAGRGLFGCGGLGRCLRSGFRRRSFIGILRIGRGIVRRFRSVVIFRTGAAGRIQARASAN